VEAGKNINIVMEVNVNKYLLIICLFFLCFFSCDLFNSDLDDNIERFWAINFNTYRSYRVNAELLWEGRYCNIWVERFSGVNKSQAQQFAEEYDNKIHTQMIEVFGIQNVNFEGRSFSDIMKFADWLGNGDGKLCILLLDIKDNYRKGFNDSYIAGYFNPGDFLMGVNSNNRDMIYIDTNPGLERIDEAFKTLAHEMQHLINFVTTVLLRTAVMDTWIDEGLSAAAEWVYSGNSQSRVDWFINNGRANDDRVKGLIDQGNNFFVWGNRMNENQYAILDDYATVYLFFQWLRIQTGSTEIYRDIISSTESNHRAVVNATGYSNWETLLKTWLAANYINANDGYYGYMGELDIRVPSPSAIGNTILLAPGEGVYSVANTNPNLSGQGSNIKNAFLTATLTENYQTSSTMLTYNISTGLSDNPEFGVTTGIPIPANINLSQMERSLSPVFHEPYRIGVGDFFRRQMENLE
jgi:hypothetical protein